MKFWFLGGIQVYFRVLRVQNFLKMLMRTIFSWLLSFKIFENILRGQTIKISLKMGHSSVFLCTGAKPFIIAHHGFHHGVGKGLKNLGYQGYIYTHSPVRGSQLSPQKTRKQYFSRLCQKVDFVRLFSDKHMSICLSVSPLANLSVSLSVSLFISLSVSQSGILTVG